MIDISSAQLLKVSVHRVGNKLRDEGLHLSQSEQETDKQLKDILKRKLLKPISKNKNPQEFSHSVDIKYNEIYNLSKDIFHDNNTFIDNSFKIAKHLYSVSTHPKIPSGELICILFDNIYINHEPTQALLLAKIDQIDQFLQIDSQTKEINISYIDGIYLENIKKSAIIYHIDDSVFTYDTKSQETKYWTQDFLSTTPSTTEKYIQDFAYKLISTSSHLSNAPEQTIKIQNLLDEIAKNKTSISISQIQKHSSEIYGEELSEKAIDKVSTSLGRSLNEQTQIPSDVLEKIISKISQNIEIHHGVQIKITNPSIRISHFNKNITDESIQISITLSDGVQKDG